jgi:hypothetical protein
VLPAVIDTVETMFGESQAKELRKIPLTDNTVGRIISDITEDLCDQMNGNIKPHVLHCK